MQFRPTTVLVFLNLFIRQYVALSEELARLCHGETQSKTKDDKLMNNWNLIWKASYNILVTRFHIFMIYETQMNRTEAIDTHHRLFHEMRISAVSILKPERKISEM